MEGLQAGWSIFRGKRESARKTEGANGTIEAYLPGASVMVKYVLGWILGVPVIVLVIIYILFH